MLATQNPRFTLDIEGTANGRVGAATVHALDADGHVVDSDRANLTKAAERSKLAKRMATKLDVSPDELLSQIESKWNETLSQRRFLKAQAAAGSPDAADQIEVTILDQHPDCLRRPLSLVGDCGFAAAWLNLQILVRQEVDPETGSVTQFDPPKITTQTVPVIIREDGTAFVNGDFSVPGFSPVEKLGVQVNLPVQPPPDRAWGGAGVKRFLRGERPAPNEVFRRLVSVVNRFIDFNRSLASQETMCEMTACYVLATYLLEAFNVFGYLWPNGDKGAGKTTFIQLIAELAYLGQLILAGGSYATLRDLADYGASLAFDDAEDVMDKKKGDPDKRTLLLAGNRRGALVTVKELEGDKWVTRYLNVFCPRQFSAINLPDETLGSRTVIIPLVRSSDEERAKANPVDHATWPCDRRVLIDDLWATGLVSISRLKEYDAKAAGASKLVGRELDRWRCIFAVALWLEEEHAVEGLFNRMTTLADNYQDERSDIEVSDPVRLAVKVLVRQTVGHAAGNETTFKTSDLAGWMNQLAVEEGIREDATGDKKFTNGSKVGRMLARLRFSKGPRDKARHWKITRGDVEALARSYGISTTVEAAEAMREPGDEPPEDPEDVWGCGEGEV